MRPRVLPTDDVDEAQAAHASPQGQAHGPHVPHEPLDAAAANRVTPRTGPLCCTTAAARRRWTRNARGAHPVGAAAHVSASANDCAHVCAPGEPLRVERRHAANARIGAPAAPSRAAGPAAHGDARLDDACISARHPAFRGPAPTMTRPASSWLSSSPSLSASTVTSPSKFMPSATPTLHSSPHTSQSSIMKDESLGPFALDEDVKPPAAAAGPWLPPLPWL